MVFAAGATGATERQRSAAPIRVERRRLPRHLTSTFVFSFLIMRADFKARWASAACQRNREAPLTFSGLPLRRAGRVVRARLRRVVRPSPRRLRYRAVEQRILGGSHPLEQAVAHFAEDLSAGGVGGEVVELVGVEEEVVELLLGDPLLAPAGFGEDLLRGGVVAVGEDGAVVVGEAADVLEALAADGSQGLVGGVVG